MTHCSNVLGTVTPVREIVTLAHSRGIKVLVDGAQSVCHRDIDVRALDCDYFVCSGHKLGGPFGIGLLYCKEPLPPVIFGGGMVDVVTEAQTTFLSTLEAGTPNVSGAVGLAAAVAYRRGLPAEWQSHEAALLRRTEVLLAELPGVHILGSMPREGCLAFTLDGVTPLMRRQGWTRWGLPCALEITVRSRCIRYWEHPIRCVCLQPFIIPLRRSRQCSRVARLIT